MKLKLMHADVCLPDYWGGHHRAHICIPVCRGTTADDVRRDLRNELSMGSIGGSDSVADALRDYDQATYEAAKIAVDQLVILREDPFHYLEENDDEAEDYESVYCYFIIAEIEG